jgi:plasmid stabilization system protein ParE
LEVVWSEESKNSLYEIYKTIFEKSPQNALMVFNELTLLGDSLKNTTVEYSKDLIINDEAVRFVSKWSYKIIYEKTITKIVILDVFDSRQDPDKLFVFKKR